MLLTGRKLRALVFVWILADTRACKDRLLTCSCIWVRLLRNRGCRNLVTIWSFCSKANLWNMLVFEVGAFSGHRQTVVERKDGWPHHHTFMKQHLRLLLFLAYACNFRSTWLSTCIRYEAGSKQETWFLAHEISGLLECGWMVIICVTLSRTISRNNYIWGRLYLLLGCVIIIFHEFRVCSLHLQSVELGRDLEQLQS